MRQSMNEVGAKSSRNRVLERTASVFFVFMLGLVTVLAVSASDGVPASATAAASAEGEVKCPFLTRTKYPFLRCKADALGNIVFDAKPQIIEGLRIPAMDPFVDGPGHWGR